MLKLFSAATKQAAPTLGDKIAELKAKLHDANDKALDAGVPLSYVNDAIEEAGVRVGHLIAVRASIW
jgi:hypothetical protein